MSKAEQISLALQKLQAHDPAAAAAASRNFALAVGNSNGKQPQEKPQQQQQQPTQQLYVKIFCADGSTKSVLVDDTMSVSTVLDILVEKNHVQLEPHWGIVEHIPELYMERYNSYLFIFISYLEAILQCICVRFFFYER